MKAVHLIICLTIITLAAGCTITHREYQPNTTDPTGCPIGMNRCSGYCTDMIFDDFNRGSCGHKCYSDQYCVHGKCATK